MANNTKSESPGGKKLLINSFKELSQRQRAFGWTFMDNDGIVRKSCTAGKLHVDTFYRWMRQPLFKEYIDFLIELHTDSEKTMVWLKLNEAVNKGDVRAMRLYFELKGDLKKDGKVTIDNKVMNYKVDFGGGVFGGLPERSSKNTNDKI